MGNVLYLCDLKACYSCPHTECKHTSDISHAVNFERLGNNHWFEKERPMSKNILIAQVFGCHYPDPQLFELNADSEEQ